MSSGAHGDVSGHRIGKYALIRRLAMGGMAELFLARNTGLQGFEKIVVLKRILPHLAGNADFVEMFLHEARLAATLEHPNVVHVSDFGQAGGDYFFVMAYVHGKDVLAILRAAYRRGESLPLSHAVTITMGMAAGLHYAHEHRGLDGRPVGIVHRDISPANVLVTYDGNVKVVDFGIAKAAAQTSVTKAGVRKGKAAYMSPEQCRGREVDRRTDIYAMGVVLWEMTTMTRLHRGDNDLAMMNQIVNHEARRPSEVVPDIPPALEAIVMRCLERDPAQRYQTAEALQLALEGFAREHQIQTSTRQLARYMHALFPTQARELPWVSGPFPAVTGKSEIPTRVHSDADKATRAGIAPPVDPPVPAPTTGPGTAPMTAPTPMPAPIPTPAAWPGTPAYGGFDASITRSEVHGPPPRRAGWAAGGLIVGALVATGGWVAARALMSPATTPSAVDPETDPETAPAQTPTPPRAKPTPDEVEDMLLLVNQPDPTLALDYPRRHDLLAQLRGLPGVAPRIDEPANVALDLMQASQADDPCQCFADALAQIERDPQARFAAALTTAEIPGDPKACPGLKTRRDALARAVSPTP